MLITS
jgi:hypothetical protein